MHVRAPQQCSVQPPWRRAGLHQHRYLRPCAIRKPESQMVMPGDRFSQIVADLARRSWEASARLPPDQKHLVAITGAPGSGKSTLAKEVAAEVNKQTQSEIAAVLPMDGFHYYRAELDQMPDPKAARARRGAPWTFNAKQFVTCVRELKAQGRVSAPSFDHGVGDPKPEGVQIRPTHRIVFVEGNYVLLDQEPWSQLQAEGLINDRIFVDTDIDECMNRVFRRQTGHGNTPEQSRGRISGNDRPNGLLIQTTRVFADVIVPQAPMDK